MITLNPEQETLLGFIPFGANTNEERFKIEPESIGSEKVSSMELESKNVAFVIVGWTVSWYTCPETEMSSI